MDRRLMNAAIRLADYVLDSEREDFYDHVPEFRQECWDVN
jgi:hypothetical protein